MTINAFISPESGKRVLLSAVLGAVAVASFAASVFATSSLNTSNPDKPGRRLLTNHSVTTPGTFSLRSGYKFRGNQVITPQTDTYINLNTVITFQQGRTTVVMPVQKKVSLGLSNQNQVRSATVNIHF